MKSVLKLETGATPVLRGELRARNRFRRHPRGLASVDPKGLSGEKIRVHPCLSVVDNLNPPYSCPGATSD
jgi:hypothetical protein